jgi:thiamine-phosphate pyrophosphorylase
MDAMAPDSSVARLAQARFYAILDSAYLPAADFPRVCRAVLEGGTDIVQVRAKGATVPQYVRLLESVLPLFEGRDTPLVVNDHLEVALAYPRCGLHIGQDDVPVEKAREALGEGRILGLSTHSLEQARVALTKAHLLSYYCTGPVFPTATKPDYVPVGLRTAAEVLALNADRLPLFCIGGISRENVPQVRAIGGRRIVVVSAILKAGDPAEAVRFFRDAVA